MSGNNRTKFMIFIMIVVVVLGLASVGAAGFITTSPVVPLPLTTAPVPFKGDGRVGGSNPLIYAQTASVYTSPDGGLYLYEINDNGVGTFLDEVTKAQIDAAKAAAAASGEPATIYQAGTYLLSALPNGQCQINSLQIPISENKPFVMVFDC